MLQNQYISLIFNLTGVSPYEACKNEFVKSNMHDCKLEVLNKSLTDTSVCPCFRVPDGSYRELPWTDL